MPIAFTYQWTRDGVPIVGATNYSYIPIGIDANHEIGCTVTAMNKAGNRAAASNTVQGILLPANQIAPTLSALPIPVNIAAPIIEPP